MNAQDLLIRLLKHFYINEKYQLIWQWKEDIPMDDKELNADLILFIEDNSIKL